MNNAVFLFGLICIVSKIRAESNEIACPRQVTGTVHGTATIKCYYSTIPPANKRERKFCCLQGAHPGKCKQTVVSTSGYTANQFLERIALDDMGEDGYFTVTITGLREEDEGIYICGIGIEANGITGVLGLTIVEDSIITNDAELIYTQLRGSVTFECKYKERDPTRRKYLYKVTKSGNLNVIDSAGKTDPGYDGRVSAYMLRAGMFIVKIAQVRVQDAAHYVCASDDPEESKDSPTYDVRINQETDIPQGPRLLTPRLGGSLSAQCNYNPKKSYTKKFWCKLKDGVCNPIITSNGNVMDAYEGKVLLHDNPTSGLMQVLMNNISKEDGGWYWCVLTNDKHDQTSAVQVRISEENLPGLSGNKLVKVTAGDPAQLSCSYPCRFKKDEKYWCRWRNYGCQPMSNVEDTQNSKLISCQTEKLLLNIESVSQKDSGYYFCGVKYGSRYGETVGVHLVVEEPSRDVSNSNVRGNFAGDSRNVPVVDTPASTDNNKSGTITAAVVSVCAAVLVVCAVFLFLRLRRRKNSDLVSVGSYRTNISMSELDRNVGKENPGVTDLQETDLGHSQDSPKIKKKGSQEDLDYSCFLINHVGTPNEQVAE